MKQCKHVPLNFSPCFAGKAVASLARVLIQDGRTAVSPLPFAGPGFLRTERERDSIASLAPSGHYVQGSVGIAAGFLRAALHLSGPATLTHTPSPMGFLSEILQRPKNQRPFALIPVGLPSPGAAVPAITKKDPAEALEIK